MEYIMPIIDIKELSTDLRIIRVKKPVEFSFTPGSTAIISINQPELKDKIIPLTFISLNKENFLDFIVKKYEGKLTEKFYDLGIGDELIMTGIFHSLRYTKPGVFLAGGIGVVPFLAIFRQLYEDGKLENNRLIYSAKTKSDLVFEEELTHLLRKNITITLTQEKREKYLLGRISKELLQNTIKPEDEIYIAGTVDFINEMKSLVSQILPAS